MNTGMATIEESPWVLGLLEEVQELQEAGPRPIPLECRMRAGLDRRLRRLASLQRSLARRVIGSLGHKEAKKEVVNYNRHIEKYLRNSQRQLARGSAASATRAA